MKEQLISFETAKLAKEKGFNIPCMHSYIDEGDGESQIPYIRGGTLISNWNESTPKSLVSVPTQSLLQKWLREEHNIDVNMSCYGEAIDYDINKLEKTYTVRVDFWANIISIHDGTAAVMPEHLHLEGSNYEEVLEKGLYQALKLIKTE